MSILFDEKEKTFHLSNKEISYVIAVLPDGQLGQVYFGKRIRSRDGFSHLIERKPRPMSSCVFWEDKTYSRSHLRQEYGVYGTSDYRSPAVEVLQENGSRISDFQYDRYEIREGKPELEGLPAVYTEEDSEAQTLIICTKDPLTDLRLELSYTVFEASGIIARNARFVNEGGSAVCLTKAMSLCLDLPDCEYEWMQFSGAWARERYPRVRVLEKGIQSVGSVRGHSSHEHNPFVILKRPHTDEFHGEAMGISLVYSGNFIVQAEVDSHDTTRILTGIHPDGFGWKLEPGEGFQTPEALIGYTDRGLNALSQMFHELYRKRLARGRWRDRARPILLNNWEATYMDFDEEKLLTIAEKAKECGVEMFVLDDGWFGKRENDRAGLGDWTVNRKKLPGGIGSLAQKIREMGLQFGLWFEPEMVNEDSELYQAHPDWILETPGRRSCHGRYQYVLDFSRSEVVDAVGEMMEAVLEEAEISYVKWDMNRSITECYSKALPPDRQGEVFHRYILGVYSLYDRLIRRFPGILFESCASGGGRFDPGMLYYAPQAWTSDNTDAAERLKIQYGSSFGYPVSSMGSHVSVVPNHQVNRVTPLYTRANVAYFGTFGYELDLNSLSGEEQEEVKKQIAFMKKYRYILQFGRFYRLSSPFEKNIAAWMAVSEDRREAVAGWYKIQNGVNQPYGRLRLAGLDPDILYQVSVRKTEEEEKGRFYGDELMYAGLVTTDPSAGEALPGEEQSCDYDSRIFILRAREG